VQLSYEKLQGLDRDRVISAVDPVLRAHGVDAVELVWRSDQKGWVLYLTVERPGTTEPGAGITLDLCADISRDLSAALDVADVIPNRYRLEVGSPGVERSLYGASDYARFSGHSAKLKLKDPHNGHGRTVVRGTLHGLDEVGRVVFETESGEQHVPLEDIQGGRLVFEWQNQSEGRVGRHGDKRGRSRRS
jgi:ribosome maturation factor RimP